VTRRSAVIAAFAVFVLFGALVVPGSAPQRWLLGRISARMEGTAPRGIGFQTGSPQAPALRVAVGAMVSPERAYVHYGRFFAALAAQRGQRVELVQRTTYREVNDLLREGAVDLAWICTGAWPELEREGAAQLVAVPRMYGKTTYQSFLIAGPSSDAATWSDLRGARFAFTDPLSLTGRLWPLRRLRETVGEGESFFGSTLYTHGHDLSIEAVRRGLVEAASVDSLVYLFLEARSPREVEGVRVLERSPELPIPPLVVSGALAEPRVLALRSDLFELADSAEGRGILAELAIDGLVPADAAPYRELR
jgi:phosphonate transport system substrate-binding protein